MIKVQNLTKDYGQLRAVDNISFNIPKSGIIGILGPNGAGKTTTLKMMTCFMPPTEGTVFIDDKNIYQNSVEIRKMIGYLPEGCPIYTEMNVVDFLYFIAELRDIEKNTVDRRVKEMIDACGLEEVVSKEIGELSKGYKQRVGLAAALIHDPEILILDEPTSGLDPNQIAEIRMLIKELGKEKTVLVSTHILSEVEAICERVIIIDRGKIVADASLEDIQSSFHNQNRIFFEIQSKKDDDILPAFEVIEGVESLQLFSKHEDEMITKFFINYSKDMDIRPALYNFIKKNKDWTLLEMRTEQHSLEDIFRQLTEKVEEVAHA
ncbi:MAG: ATP-binding cassette domain-containing protein [Candidatus Cloacimonetes bacterium]|nr:ATP-binding cassette domain-containing protein [Candidatus Cloacimonadota bacterium]